MWENVFKTVVDVSTVLGSLSLVVTVLLLIREVRENNKLVRAANAQALVEISGPVYMGEYLNAKFTARSRSAESTGWESCRISWRGKRTGRRRNSCGWKR